jgi:hypothetical protein
MLRLAEIIRSEEFDLSRCITHQSSLERSGGTLRKRFLPSKYRADVAVFLCWPIAQTLSAQSGTEKSQTLSAQLAGPNLFPLPWSHYTKLLAIKDENARQSTCCSFIGS